MTLPLDVFHRSPEEAARRIALSFLDEARAACDRLADPDDAEALHDFRVAIRRMRSTLRAWRGELEGALDRSHAKALSKLQRATGGGRDAEVALEWLAEVGADLSPAHRPGHQWLADRLSAQLGTSMDHVRDKIRRRFHRIEDDVRARLECMTVEVHLEQGNVGMRFGDAFARKLRKHMKTLGKHLSGIHGIEDEDEAHEARIRCKRLRYLTEPVARLVREGRKVVKQCKRLQDVLGDLNDSRVLRDETGRALPEAAAAHAIRLYEHLCDENTAEYNRELRVSERSGLLEITRRLQARQRALFSELRRRWLKNDARDMVDSVEALARRVETLVGSSEEIERKYLLSSAPEIPAHAEVRTIEQGYLATPEVEERVRRQRVGEAVKHTRTIKLGSGVRRTELEESIDDSLFATLWPLTEGRRVTKRRHVVREGGDVWEIDEFLDRDLWLAEIELDSAEGDVVLPAWLAPFVEREVTESGEYGNRKLAM